MSSHAYTAEDTWKAPAVPLTPDTAVRCDEPTCTWAGTMRDTAVKGDGEWRRRVCPACERRVFRSCRGELIDDEVAS